MRKDVVLKFLWTELLYDIKNYAYVESDVMEDAGDGSANTHARHQTADIGEEGNVDRVRRILSVVHQEVIDMLYPYTKKEVVSEEISDVLEEPESYDITMNVPDSMSRTTMQLLSKLVHEYMVYRVLADWLSVTNAKASANWQGKADLTKKDIDLAKNMRREPLTRKTSPF